MRRVIASALLGTVSLVSFLSPTSAPVQAAETYTRESLDQTFRLERSKTARNFNGYVYNSSNRRSAHMQLLVEGLDAAGTVITKTMMSVLDVPLNYRAFCEGAESHGPTYRVSVLL